MPQHLTSIHRLEKPSLLASQGQRPFVKPTPQRPLIISASELSEFLRCRVKHHWSYQCGLMPRAERLPLAIGIAGHAIVEQYYQQPLTQRSAKRMRKLAKQYLAAHGQSLDLETRDLLTAMTVGYADWSMSEHAEYSDTVIGVGECATEEWFELPLVKDGSIIVRGRFDVRFQSTTMKKTMALLESKFKSQIRYDEIENKIQLSVYLWALSVKFPKMRRYIAYYQIMRKQMPGPRVRSDLFFREPVERTADEIQQWVIDTQYQALDMLTGAVYPSAMDSCSWSCDFKGPCLLRGAPTDLKHILATEYTKR